MKHWIGIVGVLLMVSPLVAVERTPEPLVRGLKNPASVIAGTDGRVYVTTLGEIGKDGDGAVVVLDKDKAKPFAKGLDDPRGIASRAEWLYVVDKNRVWRIDRKGKTSVFAAANAFTPKAHSLRGIDIDETGTLYVSDAGDEGPGWSDLSHRPPRQGIARHRCQAFAGFEVADRPGDGRSVASAGDRFEFG